MNEIFAKVKELGFPLGEYIVVGGGALAARGIRTTRDLDILVSARLFDEIAKEWQLDRDFLSKWKRDRLVGGEIEIYHDIYWDKTHVTETIKDLQEHVEIIQGIPFQALKHLKQCKLDTGREKDLDDVRLIDEFLKK